MRLTAEQVLGFKGLKGCTIFRTVHAVQFRPGTIEEQEYRVLSTEKETVDQADSADATNGTQYFHIHTVQFHSESKRHFTSLCDCCDNYLVCFQEKK